MKTLNEIAKIHGTDKSSKVHDYCRKYEKYFSFKRDEPLTILEIGVLKGESLRMWKEYYPQSQIIGIDIEPASKLYSEEERIIIEIGSQTDPEFLKTISQKYGPFDMILDDGSHVNSDVIYSFQYLFDSVKPGGIYVVEDTCTSYWESYGGGLPRTKVTTIEYFKDRIDEVNFLGEHVMYDPLNISSHNYTARKDSVLLNQYRMKGYVCIGTEIESINFLNSIIIITKR